MRQAGRYQPEYRKIREKYTLREICLQPELAAEVTLLPVAQLGVDAAILFSDIIIPIQAVGVPVVLEPNVGPVLDPPMRTLADLEKIRPLQPEEDVPYVLEAIRILRRELKVPLIGFAGGPFTIASYLIEGRATRKFLETKRCMFGASDFWHELMRRLTGVISTFLRAQVEAGAQAVQLFDSWVGCLSPRDYLEFAYPYSRAVLESVADLGVPRIHFGVGTGELLPLLREAGAEVVGVDWTVPLQTAWERVGSGTALQGNLEPHLLLGPPDLYLARTKEILEGVGGRPGHIFNLGHGVLPDTPVDALKRVVEAVHAFTPE